tara:strand:+ start:132 stop:869 length:738 start_codon:yes stop_codon:yes gene_type:complete
MILEEGERWKVIQGDCLEVMPDIPDGYVDAVITDPPYGMNLRTDNFRRGRSAASSARGQANDYARVVGDDSPFDPLPFLVFPRIVLFGANWYADKLPVSGAWIVWDKLDGLKGRRELGFNDNSDCELIWTNKGVAARIIRHRWMGVMRGSERIDRRVHPTQKPVAVMVVIIRHYTNPGDLVFDPFCGSGSTGVAAIRTGRRFLGAEIDPGYCAIARERIVAEARQGSLPLSDESGDALEQASWLE